MMPRSEVEHNRLVAGGVCWCLCPVLCAGENHCLSWGAGMLFVTAFPEGRDCCGSGFTGAGGDTTHTGHDRVCLLVVPWSGECSATCPSRECCMATCCLKHKGPEQYKFWGCEGGRVSWWWVGWRRMGHHRLP